MISRYGIFCRVADEGSITRVAEEVGYTQSAVSQTVRTLERELGTVLFDRRDGMTLTADGAQYLPYLRDIARAEQALAGKQREMEGLFESEIRIGTFTSVSRNVLPRMMQAFRKTYPDARFVLRQGEYTNIAEWIREGSIDFGFVNADAVTDIPTEILYRDRMVAVLPPDSPLAGGKSVTPAQLAALPFILLDEGAYSLPLRVFRENGLTPHIAYKVYDDYSILAMVRAGLGVSMMYETVVDGFGTGIAVRPVDAVCERTVAMAWKDRNTMPLSARRFTDFIRGRFTGNP